MRNKLKFKPETLSSSYVEATAQFVGHALKTSISSQLLRAARLMQHRAEVALANLTLLSATAKICLPPIVQAYLYTNKFSLPLSHGLRSNVLPNNPRSSIPVQTR
jgi:hypothetical protein